MGTSISDLTSEALAFADQQGLAQSPEKVLELKQSWLAEPSEDFLPGVALLYASSEGLDIIVTLMDKTIFSEATGFNQKTWELGDVVELFAGIPGFPAYWEIHVTPNDHRLQLQWTAADFDSVRKSERQIEEFHITEPDFITSSVSIDEDSHRWSTHIFLPWKSIGIASNPSSLTFEIAICRYDASPGKKEATLSSTANLTKPSYHRRHEWTTLTLDIPEI